MSECVTSTLPPGWVSATLGDVLQVIRGVTYKGTEAKQEPVEGYVPVLRANNIERSLNFDNIVFIPERFVTKEQYLLPGDIIIAASSGSRNVVGKAAQLRSAWVGSFGAFCYCLRPHPSVNSSYVALFLQTSRYRNYVSERSAGINIHNLRREHIESVPILIPPPAEQRRIVAAIETQLTRLDAAVTALKRARENVKRYRAAVLKAACEGRLVPTEAELARAEGRKYEPADALLRRAAQELGVSLRASPLESTGRGTNPLPDGWAWARVDQISRIQGGIQKQPKRAPASNAYPYLRVANVLRGRLDLSEIHRMELFGDELQKLRLQIGDLLVVEGNGSRPEIGRMAVWNGAIENCVHQNHIIRVRPVAGIDSRYVQAYWNSPSGVNAVMRVASSTSGLYTLSVAKVGQLVIPLPPLAEQRRIVAEVERRLSVAENLEKTIEASLKRVEGLRQAILARAFAGKLVPQDPSDEPASVLLERIRAERLAAGARTRGRRATQPRLF